MSIRFNKTIETARFRSPILDMREAESRIERRQDPLTGRWATYSSALAGKREILFGPTDPELVQRIAEQTRPRCFFCPEQVERTTPRYPEAWVSEGYLRRGECFLFPNLFPIGAVHAVIVLGQAHYRPLDDFPPGLVLDGLGVSVEFLRSVHRADPEIRYFTINANYLFPAGASLVHPHLQVLGGRYPATAVQELTDACGRYRQQNNTAYFEDLVREEKAAAERYAGSTGTTDWLASFAPMGTNEFLGVTRCAHLGRMTDPDLEGLARGLSFVLAYYRSIGFSTFNFTVYSPPLDDRTSAFPVFVRVVCRQNVYANYRCDDYFVQKLLGEELILITPEQLAGGLSGFLA